MTERERLGRLVRETWVSFYRGSFSARAASGLTTWANLSDWDREANQRIADAVATEVRGPLEARIGRLLAYIRELEGLPAPDSGTRQVILDARRRRSGVRPEDLALNGSYPQKENQ
jgi:hypothetical protein